jgi:hypothetical protein
MIVTLHSKDGLVVASWKSRSDTGKNCEEALSTLGKELDELIIGVREAVRQDLDDLMNDPTAFQGIT